ncbi:MAG: hypothetical protein RLZZ630_1133 [Bacteroidota bacterium]|jgi:asparagine synthase (glutamine-hydrolysing)
MCGIAGVVERNPGFVDEAMLGKMAEAIRHRGPDHQGVWVSGTGLAGFSHRRLSIIDLNPSGNQPMQSPDGRFTIVFNGEIYNYVELRDQLVSQGFNFRSSSDTEVLLALYEKKGTALLDDLDGMFSMAIWDEQNCTLFCARDRFGEKPFFYNSTGDRFVFASEIKAIRTCIDGLDPDLDLLQEVLLSGRQPNNDEACFKGVSVLPPASFLVWSSGRIRVERYWHLAVPPVESMMPESEMVERFDELLNISIRRRLRSDVPYGSSLSGGIDSSVLVCRIHQLDEGSFSTFSARFQGARDEGRWIQEVIGKTGLVNKQVWPDPSEMLTELGDLLWHHEYPIASASVFAQWSVMRLAKENGIKVLLDGQGADEYLAGYDELKYYAMWSMYRAGRWSSFFRERRLLRKNTGGRSGLGYKFLLDPILLPLGIHRPVFKNGVTLKEQLRFHVLNKLGELLRYADRNSMAHSVEVRLPFLFHPLVEFVFSLPDRMIYRNGYTKFILREASRSTLPNAIYSRTDKIGYEPPQLNWLSGPDWKELLHDSRLHLKELGIDPGPDQFRILVVSALLKRFNRS